MKQPGIFRSYTDLAFFVALSVCGLALAFTLLGLLWARFA